jgi:transcriptional regulator with XRE-family HTH domain
MSAIGEEVKLARLRAGMTSKQLSDEIGLTQQYVGDIQHGRRLPSVNTLLVIANVFPDVDSADWLWLLLMDQWGEPVVALMRRHARVTAAPAAPGQEGER